MATSGKSNIEVTADTKKARKTMGDFFRDIENSGRKFNQVLSSLDPFNELQRDAVRTSRDVDELREAARRLDSDLDNLGDGNNLDALSSDADSAANSVDDVSDSFDEMGAASQEAADKVDQGFGLITKAAIGFTGIITAAAGGLALFIKGGDDLQRALNGIQAATGSSTEEMDSMKDSLKDIYRNNYGESFEDIAASMTKVQQVTGLADEELEAMTQNGLMLRDTFEYEVSESVLSANNLMKNFGESGEEAYALIAEGSRKGLNYADDLLGTIDEYSVYYKNAGFSAEEMLGMWENAKNAGVFNLDYAADAFKEFGIIMTEDSEKASDALGRLGLPAGQLIEDFAKGGDTAKDAFNTIAEELGKVENPLARNQIGVELFGTKFEDLGADAVIAMSKTNDSITGTTDVLKEIDAIKYNTIGEAISGVGRSFVTDVMIPLQDKVMPYVNEAFNDFKGWIDGTKASIKPLGDAFGILKDVVSGLFTDDGQKGRDILASMGFSDSTIMFMDDIAARIADFRWKVSDFIDGVKGLFRDDGSAGRDLLASVGLDPSLIMLMDEWAHNLSMFRGSVKETWGGIQKIFQGDTAGGRDILRDLGFSESFIAKTWAIVDGIKTIGGIIKDVFVVAFPIVKSIVSEVVSFLIGHFKKIFDFGTKEGPQFFAAISNVFNGIMAVIKFVMPAVLAIIKSIWGNIQGVITGALDVIMGVVKVFSGLFTGDFKKMWEGLKQVFFGAIEFLWNFVQLTFFGKILGGAKAFVLSFRTFFVSLWQGIISLFKGNATAAMVTLRTAWATILREVTQAFTKVWNFFRDIFLFIKNVITGAVAGYIRVLSSSWSSIFNTTKTIFTNVYNFFKSIFTRIRDFISGSASGILNKIRDTWSSLKNNTTGAFRDIYNGIKTKFTDIVNLAKGLPKRIGDGIGAMASKVTSGVTKVINKLASTLGKGVNGVIGGINSVLSKIGVDEKNHIDKWAIPQYAHGTQKGAHPGGLAIVGDGTGSNAGPEIIEEPGKEPYLSPGTSTLVNLAKGAKVWSAKVTKEILAKVPKYKFGDKIRKAKDWAIDQATHIWEGGKKLGKKVVNTAFDVFDYIKNPSKLLDAALSALGINKPGGTGFTADMAKGAWNKVKSGAVGFVKGKLANFADQRGQGFGSLFRKTSSFGMRRHPITGKLDLHRGDDYGAPAGTPIPAQAAGQVVQAAYHALRGNYVRIKSGIMERVYQHNARNLVGVGETVRKGQAVGTVGSTGASTGPHLHYEVLKNSRAINPAGFFKGGIVKMKQLAWVAEKGMEAIIPLVTNRAEGINLWRQVGEHFGFKMDALMNPDAFNVNFAGNGMEQMRSMSAAGSKLTKAFQPTAAGSSQTKQPVIIQTVLPNGRIMAEEYIDDFNAEDQRRKKMKRPNKGGRLG